MPPAYILCQGQWHISLHIHTSLYKHADCVTKAPQVQMRNRQSFSCVALGIHKSRKSFQYFRRHPGTNCLLFLVLTTWNNFFVTRRCKDTAFSSAAFTLSRFSHRDIFWLFSVQDNAGNCTGLLYQIKYLCMLMSNEDHRYADRLIKRAKYRESTFCEHQTWMKN